MSDELNEDGNERYSDFSESYHPAWVLLKEMHAQGDFQSISEMVKVWLVIKSLGRFGKILKWIIVKLAMGVAWLAGLAISWGVLTGELQKWLVVK